MSQSMQEPGNGMVPNTTTIPNIVLDDLMPTLSGSEEKIVRVICRQTYGWHKKSDKISNSQMLAKSGLEEGAFKRAVRELCRKQIIVRHIGIGRVMTEYSMQYDATKWEGVILAPSKIDPSETTENTPSEGVKKDHNKRNAQKKLSKENKDPAAREAPPQVNDILKIIYEGTENKQSLFSDHKIRKLVEKSIEADGVDALKASLAEYLAEPFLKEKRAHNFMKFFSEKATRERYKPKATAANLAEAREVHWLDSTETTDEYKIQRLTKGILDGNLLPVRWIEWEKEICDLLTRQGHSTSEILSLYKVWEKTARIQTARMAS